MSAAPPTSRIITFPGPSAMGSARRPARKAEITGVSERLAVLKAIAPDAAVSVLMVTLDESAGWQGEAAAQAITRQAVRATDMVSRVGHGRIAVILQSTREQKAAEIAARLSMRLRSAPLFRGAGVSVSAATGTGSHGEALMEAASSTLPECGCQVPGIRKQPRQGPTGRPLRPTPLRPQLPCSS